MSVFRIENCEVLNTPIYVGVFRIENWWCENTKAESQIHKSSMPSTLIHTLFILWCVCVYVITQHPSRSVCCIGLVWTPQRTESLTHSPSNNAEGLSDGICKKCESNYTKEVSCSSFLSPLHIRCLLYVVEFKSMTMYKYIQLYYICIHTLSLRSGLKYKFYIRF